MTNEEPETPDDAKPSGAEPVPRRRHPLHGVFGSPDTPTIVFVTACTRGRAQWLATEANHSLLRRAWAEATAWRVGRYVVMPDHIHFFCSPGPMDLSLEAWMKYWKSQFSRAHGNRMHKWQTDYWDRRLRTNESWQSKWEYVVRNPVRHNLVQQPEDWPFQGEISKIEE